jgi:hypothetical protein
MLMQEIIQPAENPEDMLKILRTGKKSKNILRTGIEIPRQVVENIKIVII